jgi:hypothetical protein
LSLRAHFNAPGEWIVPTTKGGEPGERRVMRAI